MRDFVKLYRVELILSSIYLLLAGTFALRTITENSPLWQAAKENIEDRLAIL